MDMLVSSDAASDADVAPDEGAVDGAVDDAGAAQDGGDVDMFVEADLGPVEPEVCNGEDDDLDGIIDEGVSNVCGGCGGLPPEGCQAWRVNLVQSEADTVIPDRVVGLVGSALGFSEQRIEGATCEVVRVPAALPDAHLGQVNIDSALANLNLGPVYDENLGGHRYLNTPELGGTTVHDSGDVVEIRAGGGLLVGPFELELEAPTRLAGVAEADLEAVAALAEGRADEAVTLTWEAAQDPGARLRFFVGGSRPIFRTAVYRGTDSYQIQALLRDDGALELDPELFGGGLPESAIRVELAREREVRLPRGSHSLTATIGKLVRFAHAGPLDRDAPRPFQITEPSPNTREITPGEPLRVAWSALPAGAGPLTVTLILQDNAIPERRQMSCVVDDPAAGAITLPASFTEGWPMGDSDVRVLAVRWNVYQAALPAPDEGTLVRAQTVQMTLEP
jgi:hypothetical protein